MSFIGYTCLNKERMKIKRCKAFTRQIQKEMSFFSSGYFENFPLFLVSAL